MTSGVGIDIGGTSTRVVTYDSAGAAVHATVVNTPSGVDALVAHLSDEVAAARAVLLRAEQAVEAVGVGVPGTVRNGMVSMALNVGIEAPVELGRLVADRIGQEVWVENDVNAAALGAVVARGNVDESLVLLSVGTGIAAGLVAGGRLLRGSGGAAGEIGHLPIPGRTEPCPCGQVGCIETVASGRAIVERMTAAGIDGGAAELWVAAAAGEERAQPIRDDVVATLAWAVQLLCSVTDAQRVVLGGGVGVALSAQLAPDVRSELARQARESSLLAHADSAGRVIAPPAGAELGALGAFHAACRAAEGHGDAWPSDCKISAT